MKMKMALAPVTTIFSFLQRTILIAAAIVGVTVGIGLAIGLAVGLNRIEYVYGKLLRYSLEFHDSNI